MAIAVSAAFKKRWQTKNRVGHFWRVRYRRRYYDAAASPAGIVLEDDWHVLYPRDFVSIGPIPQALDTPYMNFFRTTEFTVRLPNEDGRWYVSTAVPSVFAADDAHPDGYIAFGTVVNIQFAYRLPDGTMEWIDRFTGVIHKIKPVGRQPYADLTLSSKAIWLERSDANRVADSFTDEPTVPPEGDGSNDTFATASTGVDHLTAVEASNPGSSPEEYTPISQGDWEVSGTNELGPASITIGAEYIPAAGSKVRTSGVRWKRNLKIEELAEMLFHNAGLADEEFVISPVIFPGGLSGNRVIDDQEDWESGSAIVNIDTVGNPGAIRKRWNNVYHHAVQWGNLDISIDDLAKAYGTWYIDGLISLGIGSSFRYHILYDSATGQGYYLELEYWEYGHYHYRFKRSDGYVLDDWNGPNWCGLIRIERNADGEWQIKYQYGNDTLRTFTDNSYTASTKFYTEHTWGGGGGNGYVADIWWSPGYYLNDDPISTQPKWDSDEFDLLTTPIALGRMDVFETLNGGTIEYFTAFHDAPGQPYPDEDFVARREDGQIMSEPGRYFKVRALVNQDEDSWDSPECRKIKVNFSVASVNVTMANHGDKKGLSMLERYVQIPDYEMGFSASGIGFIRPKSVSGSPVAELTQENGIVDVLDFDDGTDRIINVGQVRSGNGGQYYVEYDCAAAGDAEPTSERIYGRCPKPEDYTDILLANDVDLSTSRARSIKENNYRAKRRLKLRVWDIPWLELGDIVRISYYEHPLMRQMIAGDPLNRWGSQMLSAGEAQNVLARDWDMKVIEWIPDPMDPKNCILTVEEILS